MKLAEALVLRADAKKRIERLRERLKQSALVQEGDEPPEAPEAMFAELDRLLEQITVLIKQINRTNVQSVLPSTGQSLTDALADRDALALRFSILQTTAEAGTPKFDRRGRSEIRTVPTMKVSDLRREMDDVARVRRELDTKIQSANWTTDLIE